MLKNGGNDELLVDTVRLSTKVLTSKEIASIYGQRISCDHILNQEIFDIDLRQFKKHTQGELFIVDGESKLVGCHLKNQIAPGINFLKNGLTRDGLEVGEASCIYQGKKKVTESVMFPNG